MLTANRRHPRRPPRTPTKTTSTTTTTTTTTNENPTSLALTATADLTYSTAKLTATVYETINSHYKEYINTFQFCIDLHEEVGAVQELLESATRNIQRVKEEPNTTHLTREISYATVQVNEAAGKLSMLEILAKLHGQLQSFDNLMDTGEFTSAATSVREMSSMLDQLTTLNRPSAPCDPAIFSLVRSQCIKKRSTLKHRLDELLASSITFSTKGTVTEMVVTARITATYSKNYFENPVALHDILIAFDTLDILQDKLTAVSTRIIDALVLPFSETGKPIEITTPRTKLHATFRMTSTSGSVARPTKESVDGENNNEHVLLIRVLELSRFIASSVYASATSRMERDDREVGTFASAFGDIWWDQLWTVLKDKALESDRFSASIGSHADVTAEYLADFARMAVKFENDMKEIEMMPRGRHDISDFVQSKRSRHAQKRRAELLATAREILTSEDNNTVEVNNATERGGMNISSEEKGGIQDSSEGKPDKAGLEGKEGAEGGTENEFRLPTCHITVQTQTLVEMAYQTLMETRHVDGQTATELFYCARDLFDLFRAIAPVHQAETLESSPARAMLFHNDCAYIAHHLLTLGYQFKGNLPSPLDQTATFVDVVPAFRKLGENSFRQQMRKQRDLLLEGIRSANGLGGTYDDDRFETVERALKRCTHRLTNLSKIWKAILPAELYLKAMGMLLDTTLESIMEEVKKLPSIRAEERHQLRYLMELLRKGDEWFELNKTRSGIGRRKVVEKIPVGKYSQQWEKYSTFVDLLQLTVVEFRERGDAGYLKDFSSKEVEGLRIALFGATDDGSGSMEM